ncbi:hypothetical protein EML15_09470 [Corynebacterium sp. sy017]|uniref:hypothetical protein n=1 Tax=unclassified Corynebacterium TaxID=2624378 RepID=UPI00163D44AF|nr:MULTISPECIES: hypothetical protein [unclassified Corynebacterium]MBP3089367.1 hypothetical protein [Corynebacterium sp. sy017]
MNVLYQWLPEHTIIPDQENTTFIVGTQEREVEPRDVYSKIQRTITEINGGNSLLLFFEQRECVIHIKSGFSVTLYGLNEQETSFIQPLAAGQGLYLKYYKDGIFQFQIK